MTTELPWRFEPTDPEGIRDTAGLPWQHAVRGRKPQRPAVMGYGPTPTAADADARTKATQQDAREVLGQRGEVVTSIGMTPLPSDMDMITRRAELKAAHEAWMKAWSVIQ